MLTGKVFITGGTGFLGRAIMTRARVERWPADFTLYSRDDQKHAHVRRWYPEAKLVRGDVADADHLTYAMAGHDIVIHAAAAKYVDQCELAAWDTVRTNIDGSRNVLTAALANQVQCCVGISTDKVVEPVNVYGMSKAVMERLFQEAAGFWSASATRFVCVRYGNVVSSTGSVFPRFRQQIREDGKVQVTDPDMTRFWLSVNRAVDLIDGAVMLARSGEIFLPELSSADMRTVAQVAWDEEGRAGDVEMEIIGRRPGEKIHELMLSKAESSRAFVGEQFVILKPPGIALDFPPRQMDSFTAARLTPAELSMMLCHAEAVK